MIKPTIYFFGRSARVFEVKTNELNRDIAVWSFGALKSRSDGK